MQLICGRDKLYLYTLKLPSYEEGIAALECSALTGARPTGCFALGDRYAPIADSAYLDTCVEILTDSSSLQGLYQNICELRYGRDLFRIRFINTEDHIDFKNRKEIEREISDIFAGYPDLKHPRDIFAVTHASGRWMFGIVRGKCENRWLKFSRMPHTFCNSLNSRMARALVSIAGEGRAGITLLDPCCGMGGVVAQALDCGLDAYGFDIDGIVARDANKNLSFFGFPERVVRRDASQIEGHFDTSVIDLPYGVLSAVSPGAYEKILANARNICSRSVILSARDISDIIASSGFCIAQRAISHKGGLDRHIYVCR